MIALIAAGLIAAALLVGQAHDDTATLTHLDYCHEDQVLVVHFETHACLQSEDFTP